MSKGRNTMVVRVRLPDSVHAMLVEQAKSKELELGTYLRRLLTNFTDRMRDRKRQDRLNVKPNTENVKPNHRGVTSRANTLDNLRKLIKDKESSPLKERETLPIYNPAVHKAGDRVLVRPPHSKRLIEITIPELDADGQPM